MFEGTALSPGPAYAFARSWSITQYPLTRYLCLVESWQFTQRKLQQLRAALAAVVDPQIVRTVAAAGSLGRMEASAASDADLIVILADGVDPDSAVSRAAYESIFSVCPDLQLEQPNPKGVFGTPCRLGQLCGDRVGKADEPLRDFGKRLLLLLETQPIFGDEAYDEVISSVVAQYATNYVASDPKKEWTFLMNDLIRYFRSLCVNYQWDFEREKREQGKWPLRNVKLRNSRLIMYGGLLFLLGEASKERVDKVTWLKERLRLTPLERLAWVYEQNRDYNFHRISGLYNSFLAKVGDPHVRGALKSIADYDERFRNEVYADLKSASDALVAELIRFVFARRQDWSERFFEYLIF